MMDSPQYQVLTWDIYTSEFTPQDGVPSIVTGVLELRRAIRALQAIGYSCHRSGGDSDAAVLIERIDSPISE